MSRFVFLFSISVTIILSVISIAGWISKQLFLASIGDGYIPMAPLTAICFLILGAGLLLSKYRPTYKLPIYGFALLVLFSLSDVIFTSMQIPVLDIEKRMILNPDMFGPVPLGRMSPITAILFFLCSVALMSLHQKSDFWKKITGGALTIAFTITMTLLVGYLYNSPILYGQTIIPVALSTSICFLFITIALFELSDRAYFPLNLLFGNTTLVRLMRVFLPLTAVMIIAGGAIQLYVYENFEINNALIISIIALASVIIVAFITIIKAQAISHDIEKTETERDRMARIIGVTTDLVGIFNRYGVAAYLNGQFRRMVDIPVNAVIERYHITQFFEEMDSEIVSQQAMSEAMEYGEWRGELNIKTMNGKTFPVSLLIIYQTEKNGKDDWYSLIARDITEMRKSREEMEQFAYTASHDLKEPLRMIRNFMELLEKNYKDQLDEKAQKYIHFAVDGSRRMTQMINDLLEYSRVVRKEDKFEKLDMNAIVDEVITLYKAQIEELNGEIRRGNLPVITGVSVSLRMLFQNLISNALKYRKPNVPPVIKINVQEKPNEWKFSVSDNGMGITKDHFEDIFLLFHRLQQHDEYQGTGMGLALCKKVVNQHGGKIWVESNSVQGCTFYFTIEKNAE